MTLARLCGRIEYPDEGDTCCGLVPGPELFIGLLLCEDRGKDALRVGLHGAGEQQRTPLLCRLRMEDMFFPKAAC